jgi:hypothetical protein
MTAAGSMQYTIGSALQRAADDGRSVDLLVDNHWVAGTIVALDGLGVVLENEHRDRSVVRLDRVAVVRVTQPTRAEMAYAEAAADWSTAPVLSGPQVAPV